MNKNSKNAKKKKKGFTLIELIIVLAIMAIIAAIAIPNFTAIKNNSGIKADQQSCETIRRTVLMLVADETIKPDSAATPVDKAGTFTKGGDDITDVTGKTAFTTDEKTKLKAAMAEVKAPRDSAGVKFTVTVKVDSKVEVSTDNSTVVAK